MNGLRCLASAAARRPRLAARISLGPVLHVRRTQSTTSDRARSILLTSPTPADLDAQELDAEVLPADNVDLLLTTRAAEQLQRIAVREANPNVALHVSVESGGCHGYQYKFQLATTRAPEDYHLTHPDVRPSNVYVDAVTLPMINGATIDYATELIGSSFRISENPHAKGGCGCGVSWELKE